MTEPTMIAAREDGYYRKEDGTVLYFQFNPDGTKAVAHSTEWTQDWDFTDVEEADEFERDFSFVRNPDKLFTTLEQEIALDISNDLVALDAAKESFAAIDMGRAFGRIGDNLPASEALVVRQKGSADIKSSAANLRNTAEEVQEKVEVKIKRMREITELRTLEIEADIRKRQEALKESLRGITEAMNHAERIVKTLNYYLEASREMVTLRKGEPAAATDKIIIRQVVRYADEVSMLDAGMGGIDCDNLDKFDEWLLADPDNLKEALPEPKALCAFHIRRDRKDYRAETDAERIIAAFKNITNVDGTYFLVRNGENLYRVQSPVVVDDELYPLATRLEEELWTTDAEGNKVPHRPGSKEWDKAVSRLDAAKRRATNVLLVLQGIFDGSDLFHPLPAGRLNLMDPRDVDEWITLTTNERSLGDGAKLFKDWQTEANAKINIGCRVVGDFASAPYKSRDKRCRHGWSSHRLPSTRELHTVLSHPNSTTEGEFRILYNDGHSRNRTSMTIYRTDNFLINFDAVTLSELMFYSQHRPSRRFYGFMLPAITTAIAMKHKEEADEAPFRDLIANEIRKKDDTLTEEQLLEVISGLISWWKFKTREHRPLVNTDDAKALRMILKQFDVQQASGADSETDEAVLQALNDFESDKAYPRLLFAKTEDKYFTVYPMNGDNVWVERNTYRRRKDGLLELTEQKHWHLLGTQYTGWTLLQKGEAWETWLKNPVRSGVFTDGELRELAATLPEFFERKLQGYDGRREGCGTRTLLPISTHAVSINTVLFTFVILPTAAVPRIDLCGEYAKKIRLTSMELKATRHEGKVLIAPDQQIGGCFYRSSQDIDDYPQPGDDLRKLEAELAERKKRDKYFSNHHARDRIAYLYALLAERRPGSEGYFPLLFQHWPENAERFITFVAEAKVAYAFYRKAVKLADKAGDRVRDHITKLNNARIRKELFERFAYRKERIDKMIRENKHGIENLLEFQPHRNYGRGYSFDDIVCGYLCDGEPVPVTFADLERKLIDAASLAARQHEEEADDDDDDDNNRPSPEEKRLQEIRRLRAIEGCDQLVLVGGQGNLFDLIEETEQTAEED